MVIELSKLDYAFLSKPLLIGGKAMEHYGLRQAGRDIDFVITAEDYERLAQQYPDHLRDLWGDLGVCVYEFEIWKSICLFDYAFLSGGAVDAGDYLVISLEKLLFLKALGMEVEKYHKDLEMIVKKVRNDKWAQLPEEQRAYYLAQNQ
ncbi:MAG: hypothetical protein JXR84_04950 [Anaerolineae bacterium]|nr:hypothetical protein [Anaerolineae bacterium]